jgi:hypothetical protein
MEKKIFSDEVFEQIKPKSRKAYEKLTDLGLNKGRGWFLNFSDAPLIFG